MRVSRFSSWPCSWRAAALARAPGRRRRKPASRRPRRKPAAKAKAPGPAAWAELTAEQQKILAPLKADWESLEPERRRKWIGIAKRYPKMKAEEQERVQRRMQAWAKLTPEQRRQARETYKQHRQGPAGEARQPAPAVGRVPGAAAARAREPSPRSREEESERR